ncbi:DUF6264 family protein [Microbacterium sp. NPDC056569]|uniref:DUF6264 family protein n=1 Tax=Microbacterium sp. NPDC056569 TaxID=3345867 RepID=UPI00366D6734
MSDAADAGRDPRARPRPQYGEYATPEEQRSRIQQPAPWQLEPVAPIMTDVPADGIPAAPAVAEKRQHPVDRIVTFALLAYGLVNVITSVPAFLDYGAYAETMLGVMGVDVEISDPSAGRAWAIAAVVVLAIGWCATAALSVWNMRRSRVTWWIPLVGGIVFSLTAGALMVVPLMNDPAVWQALLESTRI